MSKKKNKRAIYYRVFGLNQAAIEPAAFLEHLQQQDLTVKGQFRGDEEGWFNVRLDVGERSLAIDRYLISEDDVRAELNTWAAWVEEREDYPHRAELMQKIISAQQVFVFKLLEDMEVTVLPQLCAAICRFLAAQTGGFYHVDRLGFCTCDGTLILDDAPISAPEQ